MSGNFRTSWNDASNASETELLGGTDQTKIGNVGDRLKVDAIVTVSEATTYNRSELSRRVSLGDAFGVYTTAVSVATTETNVIYMNNPSNSGHTVYVAAALLASVITATGWSEFYVYTQPTVTSNGTALTVNNLLAGSVNASTTLVYRNPVTSTRGTLIDSTLYGSNNTAPNAEMTARVVEPYYILPPGTRLLISARGKNATTPLVIIIKWFEENV